MRPWDPLGPCGIAGSPMRGLAYAISNYILFPPLVLLVVQDQYRGRPEWPAPRGKYVKGTVYPFWSTYNIVGIAISTGFTVAAAGISYGGFDLTLFSDPFISIFYGTFITGVMAMTNIIIRCILWYGCSPVSIVAALPIEAWWYVLFAMQSFRFLEPARIKGGGRVPIWRSAVYALMMTCDYMGTAAVTRAVYSQPGAAYMAWLLAWLTPNLVHGTLMYFIGTLGTEYALRAMFRAE